MPISFLNKRVIIFQQDGAVPCFHIFVRGPHLGMKFSKETDWPPRSPDLTSLDIFFWGVNKNAVYDPPIPTTLPECPRRIGAVASTFTPPCSKMYGLNLHTDDICATILTLPSLYICHLLRVRHKILSYELTK